MKIDKAKYLLLLLTVLSFIGCDYLKRFNKDLERTNNRDVKSSSYSEIAAMIFAGSLASSEYRSGNAIPYKLSLNNLGNNSMMISELSILKSSINMELKTPDGYNLFPADPRVTMLPSAVELKPGEPYEMEFDIASMQWKNNQNIFSYKISASGEYTIKATYTPYAWEEKRDDNWDIIVNSNELKFRIIQ